jgi:hypothetical protein
VTGRNLYPPDPVGFHPRSILAMLPNCGAVLFLFELGPLALPLLAAGLVRHARRSPVRAALLAAAFAASLAFTAWLQFGPMLHLFLLPAILLGAIFVADGLDALLARVRGGGAPVRVAVAALVAWSALALPPALLRVHADRHPIGAAGWRVVEEDTAFRAGLVPGMQFDRGAEAWARTALDAFPRNALVLANWTQYTPLRHLMVLEARRPDLTLRQITGPTLAERVRQWQASHAPARAPIVFAARDARVAPFLAGADSVALPRGRFAYVVTRPATTP